MAYILCGFGGAVGGFALLLGFFAVQNRLTRGKRIKARAKKPRRAMEFTKLIMRVVFGTYLIGVGLGVIIVFADSGQLGVFLAYLGTPTTAAIGFYCWKAKAENIMKLKRENPEETAGISVDLNAVQP